MLSVQLLCLFLTEIVYSDKAYLLFTQIQHVQQTRFSNIINKKLQTYECNNSILQRFFFQNIIL